jgi:Asp-tRNA(Asn)/Glu-tRNA(Gln) amidotransferase A subunit family amidase
VRACLERVADRDEVVRAWTCLDPKAALAQARAADGAEEPRSPIHGVPVGIKDIIDTADMPTEYGSRIYARHQPAADAACVARLREAGAVILGKTKTTEFAYYHPTDTTNPHDPERTPGGSSSGSAAAVADGMVPVALGTQTAGSVIRPASFCGVLGLKPTHGLIDVTGVRPLSERLDTIGLFARTIDDLERMLGVLAGTGRERSGEAGGAAGAEAADAEAAGGAEPSPSPLIAFARTRNWDRADPDAQSALVEAATELGASEIELPQEIEAAVEAQQLIMAVDVAKSASHEYEHHRERLSKELTALIERGLAASKAEYDEAVHTGERAKEALPRVFEGVDALMTLAAPGQAPKGLDNTGDPLFCRTWTLLGTPAISVPGQTGADGMPIGVQLIAPRGNDAELLQVARWAQEQLRPE